jgi:hypothetical protein
MAEKFDLVSWTKDYVKARDANINNIEKVDVSSNKVIITHVSTSIGGGFRKQTVPKVQTYIALGSLVTATYPADSVLVVYNTRKNLDYLSTHLEEFAKNETLRILFANPSINETWQIVPSRHLRMSKMMEADLKQSILSMFEGVPEYLGL